MKTVKRFKMIAQITGIIVSLFFLLAFGPKFFGSFIKDGTAYINEILQSFVDWSDPNAFFITYFIGYTLVWRKTMPGSIIMMGVGITYVCIAGFEGPPIFAIPAFVVGLLYFIYSLLKRSLKG